MSEFSDLKILQKFAAVHASTFNHFNLDRNLNSRSVFKQNRSAALAECRQLAANPKSEAGSHEIDTNLLSALRPTDVIASYVNQWLKFPVIIENREIKCRNFRPKNQFNC
jgi:hypothetical protein